MSDEAEFINTSRAASSMRRPLGIVPEPWEFFKMRGLYNRVNALEATVARQAEMIDDLLRMIANLGGQK